MRVRDGIVLAVLTSSVVAALLVWQHGRWWSLLLVLAGLLIAAGVYRARPSAVPTEDREEAEVSTPRPAAAPRGPSSRG